jgi:hypothetical protein
VLQAVVCFAEVQLSDGRTSGTDLVVAFHVDIQNKHFYVLILTKED